MSFRIGDLSNSSTLLTGDLFEKEATAFGSSGNITGAQLRTGILTNSFTSTDFLALGTSPPTPGSIRVDGLTVTVTTPVLNLIQTWNAGGVTFTGIKLNVTSTASAAASLLMDLQVAAASQWSVTKGGATVQAGSLTVTAGGLTVTAGGLTVSAGGAAITGNSTVTGTLTSTSDLTSQNDVFAATARYYRWTSRSVMSSPADGTILLQNNATTGFTALQIGGTSASFPEIKRNAAAINFRLADDSADAAITSAAIAASGIVTTTGLTLSGTSAKIIPGATSLLIRNTGDSATNLTITDAGDATFRAGILSTAPTGLGIGYATGAGGTVTQTVGFTNPVTINKLCGQIVTFNGTLGTSSQASFTVNNSTVAATDTIVLNIKAGFAGSLNLKVWVDQVTAGTFVVRMANDDAVNTAAGPATLNFSVQKAVTS